MKRHPINLEWGFGKQNFAELYFRLELTLIRVFFQDGRYAVSVVALGGCVARYLDTARRLSPDGKDERPVHFFICKSEMPGKQRCGHLVPIPFQRIGRCQAVNNQSLVERVVRFGHIEPETVGNTGQAGPGRP